MKKANLFGAATAMVLGLGCGQDYKITEEPRDFVLNPELVDLGVVAVGEPVLFEVDATSIGGGDISILAIEIINIEGEYIDLAEEEHASRIESDSTTHLPFSYTPESEGYHWAQIIVKTDIEDDNERMIEVRGHAATPVVKVWPAVLDFGPVVPGDKKDDSVHVVNEGTVAISIDDLVMDNVVFQGNTDLPVRIAPGETQQLDLRFVPETFAEETGSLEMALSPGGTLAGVSLRGNACSTGSADLYDQDSDGYSVCGSDCDDTEGSVHPGASEVCNTVDDDCDGIIDEGTGCYDDDGDGQTEDDGDCNDGDAGVYMGAFEDPTNGIDDDCDGIVDSGASDLDGDGYGDVGGDCDEYDPTTYPGATELPDGIDNDCDGIIDEGTRVYDDDGDGVTEMEGDCDDTDARISPSGVEIPDWLDNDCDGEVDEGTAYADDDGDGFSELGGDCDDADPTVNPGHPEITGDGIDNNCDGIAL